SMKLLLSKLNVETFVLELESAIDQLPVSDQYLLRLIDPMCVEVELEKDQIINNLFDYLSANKIAVRSMRSKSNRLEELFIRLLASNDSGAHN
ncbi:MAG: ABC-2 type transport system ATP-binding protein, partial [Gammaproteobacteria bacterium]